MRLGTWPFTMIRAAALACSREWQPPITATASWLAALIGRSAAGSAISEGAVAEGGGVLALGALTSPRAMTSSVVSVPVLSKSACVSLPASGTRNGSVQKTWGGEGCGAWRTEEYMDGPNG